MNLLKIFVIILFISSCTSHNIKENLIAIYFVKNFCIQNDFDLGYNTKCNFLPDTIKSNFLLNFDEAVKMLTHKFDSIESLKTNVETKAYIKCLIASDFVYFAFSFQFLGSKEGYSAHDIAVENWNKLPLIACYAKGNSNLIPIYCDDRATFYGRLVDSLLGFKSEIITLKNIHSFPVVAIGSSKYIFDPFDPIIVTSLNQNEIIPYNKLVLMKNNLQVKVLRTSKIWGNARYLVSNKLFADIMRNNHINTFETYFKNYVDHLRVRFSNYKNDCGYEELNMVFNAHPIKSMHNKLILVLNYPINKQSMTINHFNKFYMGQNCN